MAQASRRRRIPPLPAATGSGPRHRAARGAGRRRHGGRRLAGLRRAGACAGRSRHDVHAPSGRRAGAPCGPRARGARRDGGAGAAATRRGRRCVTRSRLQRRGQRAACAVAAAAAALAVPLQGAVPAAVGGGRGQGGANTRAPNHSSCLPQLDWASNRLPSLHMASVHAAVFARPRCVGGCQRGRQAWGPTNCDHDSSRGALRSGYWYTYR
jgi:hypothetical protein